MNNLVLAWLFKDQEEKLKEAYERGKNEAFETDGLGAIKRHEQFQLHSIDELADKKLNALLCNFDVEKVVRIEKFPNGGGVIYIGGKKSDDGRLANLKSEAEFLEKSDIWTIIQESLKESAQRQMFVSSESLDDMKKGKSMLYTLSVQKNILDIFKSFKK